MGMTNVISSVVFRYISDDPAKVQIKLENKDNNEIIEDDKEDVDDSHKADEDLDGQADDPDAHPDRAG